MKTVSHKGFKFQLPKNVSMSTFKEVCAVCGGYIDVIQPMLYLLSRKLEGSKQSAINNYLKYQ